MRLYGDWSARIYKVEHTCETLLTRSGSFCIHVRNLQKLMTGIYKSMNQLNPSLIWEFHEKKDVSYNLRIQNLWKSGFTIIRKGNQGNLAHRYHSS